MTKFKSKPWHAALGFAGLLIEWQVIVALAWVPQEYLPGVPAVASALSDYLGSADFWHNEGLTLARAFGGLLLATVTALFAAILAARYKLVDRALTPLIEIMLSLPPAALVPLAIFGLGLGWKLFAFIIWFSAFWYIYAIAIDALRTSEPVQRYVARTLGYGRWEVLLGVRLPAAMPEIFTGIRIAAAGCLMAAVAAEMLAGQNGLGFMLYDTAFSLQTPQMFALLFVAGLNGIVINKLVMVLRRPLAGWHDGIAALANQ